MCWHHNEGSSSSQHECWCCWRHRGDYQIHGSFVFVPVLHIGVPDNIYFNHVLQHTFYIWQEHELCIVMESFDRDLCDFFGSSIIIIIILVFI